MRRTKCPWNPGQTAFVLLACLASARLVLACSEGGTTPGDGSSGTGGAGASDSGNGGSGLDGGTGASSGSGAANGSGGAGTTCDASSPPAITRLGLEQVMQSDDLQILVHAAQPPGSSDWYLVDVTGKVLVVSNGIVSTFLDVSAEVQDLTYETVQYDERGLLSIAFAPDYAASGRFYVALVPTTTETRDHDLILEYTRSTENPLVADPESRRAILDLEPGGVDGAGYQPGSTGVDLNRYHNASTVAFGPDGMLYVGMGDGGGQCNSARPGAPQDIGSPYGKILRLDPNAAAPHAAVGNPFADGGDPLVWQLGVRNPFRFSFDSLTGDFYVGDVGQWAFEEISFAPAGVAGLNFGWPAFEATEQTPTPDCNTNTTLRDGDTHTPPIHVIPHGADSGASNLNVAIVGGTVYRGTAIPELYGVYLFGEYYANHDMRALVRCGDVTSDVTLIHKECDPNLPNDACFVPLDGAAPLGEVGAVVSGNDGELYLAANNDTLFKIVPVEP